MKLLRAIIDDVIIEPSKIQPIIVNFQNGELKDEEAKKMSCGLFYDQNKKKTMLALSNQQIVYRGYKPDTTQDLMRTMLVFHNKKTGKARLVQVERWQVTPILEKSAIKDNRQAEDEKIAILNKQFGSKKVKRRTEQFERLKINIESIKEQLEQTVSNVKINKMELSTQLPNNEYITNTTLPECNRKATNVNDIYNIYDIVPENKLENLYNNVKEILNNNSNTLEENSKFFIRTLQYLKSDSDNLKKTALLIYIQAIATWLNMPIKDAKKRGIKVCLVSEEINSYIINTYSVQSNHGRLRPTSIKDKGVIHCMILALIICNFTLDLELFATIFSHRMGLKKLTDLARIIGALPNKEDKKIITLKIPLPAPVSIIKKDLSKTMQFNPWRLMVILTCINGVLPEYLMGGHIDNNPPKSLLEKTESSPNLARTAQLDDLDLDFVTEESTVALSTSDDEETPRYHVPYPFAFNGGKPFSLEKDPITGKIDFEKPVKALNYTNHYQELNEDEQIKDFSKGNSSYLMKKKMENKEIEDVSPNEINPYSPNFHDFLNLPIHYSFGKYDKDKYPLISNSYANTKVQSGSNSYSIYNHKPYHGESIIYYSTKKPYMSKATSITTMTTTMTTLKPTSSITPNTITISTTSKPIITSTPMTTPIIATTTTTTSPPTTTSTSMKLPVVTTWKPSISTPKRFVDYLEDYDDILPIEKLQSSMYSNNHQGSNNIVHHNRDSQTKPSIKHEEYINNYEDYEIEEDEEEIKDYVSMKETTNKVIRTSTLPTTTSISNITIITEKNPEIIPMTTTIINTSVPSSSAIHLSSVSQESILQNNSLPFQVPYLRTVTSMPLDNEYMSFENDNRKHDIADDIIMNQEYHPNTIINKKPTGEIFVESTSNILIPPDQDIVSFVLGNRQNVEGGYYSLGTAIGENPYSSSTKLDSSFRPLYNTSPNKSNYDSQTDFQEIIGLPLISALENNYTYAQWRQPNPIETQKLANEIEPPRTQNSFIKDTVFLEESENKKNDKNINHIVFPKDKPKQSVEDHIIVINEANEVKSSSTTLKPSTTLKMDPLISNEEHLPQLSENLTPPAEQPKLPSQFYYHYNYGGFTVKPDHLRLQRLPSRGKSPSSSPTLPSEFIGIRRRPYSPDSTLPNILPQFRPNAKTSHGHRGSEIIGTIPAGQTYPTRVRQSVQSYPSTRRPLLPVPFYLQRLNPPPPPIHAVRFATKIDNLISSRDTDSIVKRFHLPLISVTSRAEDIKLAHRLTNQKLRLEDEERSEHYSEEPPQLPPKPPLFPKRRIAHSPHVATLQMIQQHREFEEDITESNLPMNVPNTDDESDRIIIDQNADGRKLENHETMVESPVYVVYPVNTAVNIHPDDSREKDESVVVGTRGPHRPLPPETLLQDNENQQEMNQEIKSSVHNIFNRRPIMSDFPYPLERPDPSILINGMRETPLLVPSDQRQEENPVQENTEEKDEKDSNVNIIPYLQDFIPFPPKKNDVISATLHRLPALSSSTPIAYVYTPTVQSSHGLDVDMRDEKNSEIDKNQKLILLPSQQPSSSSSSAPSPQNFMPPFVASISAETSSKNGWSVVAMESTINRKSDDNSSEATLNVKEIQTEKTEFDAENFKPQMFGGFKPIYEFPTQNENHSEYKESNDLKTEVNTYAHESANSTV